MKKCFKLLIVLIFPLAHLASTEIVLASSASLLGSNKDVGTRYLLGAKTYFDYINELGGIKGNQIQLLCEDDSYSPKLTVQNTIKFLQNKDLLLLFNYVGTPTTNAVLPMLKLEENNNIFLFGNLTGAGSQRYEPYSRFVYNVRSSYKAEAIEIVNYFLGQGKKRIGIFYQSDDFGKSGFSGVKEQLEKAGLSIAGEVTYRKGTTWDNSMLAQAEYLKEKQVDAIISVATSESAAAFIRDSRSIGLDVPISNLSFVATDTLLNMLQSNSVSAKELYFTEVLPHYNNSSIPFIKKYRELFTKNSYDMGFVSLEGFLNAYILTEILQNTEYEITRDNIKKIIESMAPIDLGFGEDVAFTRDDHNLLDIIYIFKGLEGGGVIDIQ